MARIAAFAYQHTSASMQATKIYIHSIALVDLIDVAVNLVHYLHLK